MDPLLECISHSPNICGSPAQATDAPGEPKVRQTVTNLKKAQEDGNVCGQGCTVLSPVAAEDLTLYSYVRGQLDFKKIHTKPESGYFPLNKVQIHTLFLLFFTPIFSNLSSK